jgi:TonB family protein
VLALIFASLMSAPIVDQGERVRWISPMDYPQPLEAQRAEGTVQFELAFGPDGRVTACTIQQSSGTALLDARACWLSLRRARARAGEERVQVFRHHWLAPSRH